MNFCNAKVLQKLRPSIERIDALLQTAATVLHHTYKPVSCHNIGVKFLLQERVGSKYLSHWLTTYSELTQLTKTHYPLIIDKQLNKENQEEIAKVNSSIPIQICSVYRNNMKINDAKRNKKVRPWDAWKKNIKIKK